MKKLSSLLVVFILALSAVHAQELRCNVSVSASKIQGVNRNVFRTMQADLYEFMNNRKWTDHVYDIDERIECNIFIQLDEMISSDEFKGSMTVQLRRPVFNSTYETTLLNIKDKEFRVRYEEFQPMDFNITSNRDNLTNIMAFYAYIIIGMDYDSFAPEGGTEYFQKAQQIVNNSQSSIYAGWKAYESERNRYWLAENLLNRSYSGFRQCIYRYHRLGLDLMSDKLEDGRSEIAESLRLLQRVYRNRPNIYLFPIFFDAKADELVNIFSGSYTSEKDRVLSILNEIDPSNGSKYEKIKQDNTFNLDNE
ncbi:DUF4835 family protein [Mangrovibacterium marinum]|uniref:Uncharacterized protein DUF4835 n=1 Tax=Mangrovibacterium marinum TaxID=1639118 RepID=A0A2T5C570_9BACT|nr:DUF4835 family protein [Mangrovibacterium marinum]PTN10044.1 uncharacterized protein DUF4835 [Mangrovibacterium marinum]